MKRGPGRTGEPGTSPEATRRPRAKARPPETPETPERIPHWWADSEDNFAIGVYFDWEGDSSGMPDRRHRQVNLP